MSQVVTRESPDGHDGVNALHTQPPSDVLLRQHTELGPTAQVATRMPAIDPTDPSVPHVQVFVDDWTQMWGAWHQHSFIVSSAQQRGTPVLATLHSGIRVLESIGATGPQ